MGSVYSVFIFVYAILIWAVPFQPKPIHAPYAQVTRPELPSTEKLRDFRDTGSPPRARGQYLHIVHKLVLVRFTPTRMGTMVGAPLVGALDRVHPHACGDSWIASNASLIDNGSPPRAWGQLSQEGSGKGITCG
jgi:hypothetical protein